MPSGSLIAPPVASFTVAGVGLTASTATSTGTENLRSVGSSASTVVRQKINDTSGFPQGHRPPAARPER
jgi:hypothetical protein